MWRCAQVEAAFFLAATMVQKKAGPAKLPAGRAQARPGKARSTASRLASAQLPPAPAQSVSKSALRRQKRKQRDQLAGNQQGMQELTDVVDSMEEGLEPGSEARAASAPEPPAPTSGATVTTKMKRNMLARERARQPHILADLAQSANPFAALRAHARNTLDLRAPRRRAAAEEDERMEAP